MEGTTGKILSINNFYFISIIFAAIFVAYLFSIILKTISISLNEKKANALWLLDSLSGPLMMFVLNAGYGIGYYYLTLPLFAKTTLAGSVNILLIINLGWLVTNAVPNVIHRIFKPVSLKTAKIIKALTVGICGIILITLFYTQYTALIFSIMVALLFIVIVQKIIFVVPKPTLKEKIVIPKKLVMTHIYISTSETDEAVKRATIQIREAIQEIDGTGDDPSASLSGFTPSAFDILIRYYVVIPEKIEAVKEEVNLNIIKKLKESNIKLSTA